MNLEWYGGKEAYRDIFAHPIGQDVAKSYGRRIETILARLAEKRDCPPDSFEVKELIGEYGFVMKQLTQVKEESGMMRHLAQLQNAEPSKSKTDGQYGEGTAEFFAQAIAAFYGSETPSVVSQYSKNDHMSMSFISSIKSCKVMDFIFSRITSCIAKSLLSNTA